MLAGICSGARREGLSQGESDESYHQRWPKALEMMETAHRGWAPPGVPRIPAEAEALPDFGGQLRGLPRSGLKGVPQGEGGSVWRNDTEQ